MEAGWIFSVSGVVIDLGRYRCWRSGRVDRLPFPDLIIGTVAG